MSDFIKLDQAKADIITEILSADRGRAEELFSLELDEAVNKINELGYDFTLEELQAYSKAHAEASGTSGELDYDALDNVAGGNITMQAVVVYGVPFPLSRPW